MGFYKNTKTGSYNISNSISDNLDKIVKYLKVDTKRNTSYYTFKSRGEHRCEVGKRRYFGVLYNINKHIDKIREELGSDECISCYTVAGRFLYLKFNDRRVELAFIRKMWDKEL